METKLVRVPFDVELAKKIMNKEMEGRIVTCAGSKARIADFNLKVEGFPLLAIAEDADGGELYYSCDLGGKTCPEDDSLSPLVLEIPEYMTFKDGDVIACGWERLNESSSWISIVKSVTGDVRTNDYVILIVKSNNHSEGSLQYDSYTNSGEWIRKATKEERQKLIDALKASKDPKAKEYLKRFFGIEGKPGYEFKPFDKVLVRCCGGFQWSARFFDRIYEGYYACTDSLTYKQCIPYNGQTAHLLGTTDDWEG